MFPLFTGFKRDEPKQLARMKKKKKNSFTLRPLLSMHENESQTVVALNSFITVIHHGTGTERPEQTVQIRAHDTERGI